MAVYEVSPEGSTNLVYDEIMQKNWNKRLMRRGQITIKCRFELIEVDYHIGGAKDDVMEYGMCYTEDINSPYFLLLNDQTKEIKSNDIIKVVVQQIKKPPPHNATHTSLPEALNADWYEVVKLIRNDQHMANPAWLQTDTSSVKELRFLLVHLHHQSMTSTEVAKLENKTQNAIWGGGGAAYIIENSTYGRIKVPKGKHTAITVKVVQTGSGCTYWSRLLNEATSQIPWSAYNHTHELFFFARFSLCGHFTGEGSVGGISSW